MKVCLTVDVEQDCPPYLDTWRGIDEGMTALLKLLDEEQVSATLFTTGDVARRSPWLPRDICARGHELGCHGLTHSSFAHMSDAEANHEIETSAKILREHGPVESFRAPYLQFPEQFVPLLTKNGFTLDSSLAKYKASYLKRRTHPGIARVAASATSSVLRLPRLVRETYLKALSTPVVLFVHPWEFVDLTKENLRLDCRFKTGQPALDCLRDVIIFFKRRDASFVTMNSLGNPGREAA